MIVTLYVSLCALAVLASLAAAVRCGFFIDHRDGELLASLLAVLCFCDFVLLVFGSLLLTLY